jgi:hypothetical protein
MADWSYARIEDMPSAYDEWQVHRQVPAPADGPSVAAPIPIGP